MCSRRAGFFLSSQAFSRVFPSEGRCPDSSRPLYPCLYPYPYPYPHHQVTSAAYALAAALLHCARVDLYGASQKTTQRKGAVRWLFSPPRSLSCVDGGSPRV